MNLCLEPFFLESQGHTVNCGHCRSCRLARRHEWAMRITHELKDYSYRGVFVTLTLSNENLPANYSLDKSHLQKFFKRLRKALSKGTYTYVANPEAKRREDRYKTITFAKTRIKYFACGEYCPTTQRPHYHAVILGLDSGHRELIFRAWGLCKYAYYDFKVLTSEKAISYVSGYTSKKIGAFYNVRFKKQTGRIPPFQLSSLGFGKNYALSRAAQFRRCPTLMVNGRQMLLPRYYRKVLGITSDVIKPILEKQFERVAQSIAELYRVSIDRARREVALGGTLMRKMRIETNERLKLIESKWRTRAAMEVS